MSLADCNSASAAEFPNSVPAEQYAKVLPFIEGQSHSVVGPRCCGERMQGDGGCSTGCCSDYRCANCGFKCRVEWPD